MSECPRVLVTRVLPSAGLDLAQASADAEVWPDELLPPREVLLEKVRGVDGLLSLLTDRVDDEMLDAAGPGPGYGDDELVIWDVVCLDQ